MTGRVLALLVFPAAAPGAAQEWGVEADIALHTGYEWRGLQLDPGTIGQFAVYTSVTWSKVRLTAGAWTLADMSNAGAGIPERWAFETSPWVEVSLGNERGELRAGAVAYSIRSALPRPDLRRSDTWEVYLGASGALSGTPLLGEIDLYWDVDKVGGAYAEVGGSMRIPLWIGAVVPVGSLYLEGRSGFSLGQERQAGDGAGEHYFGDSGPTHVDLSLRWTLLPIPIGNVSASLTMEPHWIRGLDDEARRVGVEVGGTVDRTRWLWVFGMRLTVPRCQPEKELCRDL